jgi:vacuolar-type H+-ATPase subunit I/STV1
MEDNKTAIQILTKTLEELASKATRLEFENQELKKSSEDWFKYYCEKKEQVEKLINELDQVKAELEALKREKGE